ncbi:MAG: hypothetical protein MUF27_03465 [Acidobacteria bacterium]|jgi:hypothetical protein|nr:hypothetical protein [Acidobacteriota bacterium]
MTAKPIADLRKFVRPSTALALALLAAAATAAQAEELIRFKNGHTLAVRSSRVEGEQVHVVLPNGSEASFPRSIVKLTETGVVAVPSSAPNIAAGFSGRGPRGADLIGSRRGDALLALSQAGGSSSRKAIAEGYLNSNGGKDPQTVGFSRFGSEAIGVPVPGSEKAPTVSLAKRPGRPLGPGNDGTNPAAKPETNGPSLQSPDLANPADRSHGHN